MINKETANELFSLFCTYGNCKEMSQWETMTIEERDRKRDEATRANIEFQKILDKIAGEKWFDMELGGN